MVRSYEALPFGAEIGKTEAELHERWRGAASNYEGAYVDGHLSFCLNLTPRAASNLPVKRFLSLLRRRYGALLDGALSAAHTNPDTPHAELPKPLQGPRAGVADSQWLKRSNMVGVNVRTLGSFIDVAKYALTLPASQDSVHLLPIWEPGVVDSLYGMSSWKINREFFDSALVEEVPHLDTAARQLKALVNLLHLMGKSVGMDVIPHTDRFSEIVLAQPHCFEWLRREDTKILDRREELHLEVEERILRYLHRYGPADRREPMPENKSVFSEEVTEAARCRILFGPPEDLQLRSRRRGEIARELYLHGYEPVPATMAPPYRGLVVDRESSHLDGDGHIWRDYLIEKPHSMSRVFGPLTRYKLYGRKDDNRNWEIDFSSPRKGVWEYVCRNYAAVQRSYGFDFMRGDMSHVQMRDSGVPEAPGEYYDLLASVKLHIRRENGAPHFGYFAETFLSPPGIMAYGNEIDHLESVDAEATLGDLQSKPLGSDEFLQRLRWYTDIADHRAVTPSLTLMTGDKDDPRFDEFYLAGNEARLFLALFTPDMPSYMALNFECRDVHYSPGANEEYTKLYVFQERSGPKATSGPFRFGRNGYLFYRLTRIRLFAESMLPMIDGASRTWLVPPDATAGQRWFAWSLRPSGAYSGGAGADNPSLGTFETPGPETSESDGETLLFVLNCDCEAAVSNIRVPLPGSTPKGAITTLFSTEEAAPKRHTAVVRDGGAAFLEGLGPGEGVVLRATEGTPA